MSDAAALSVEQVFRLEAGRAVATLVRLFGEVDVAEDAHQGGHAAAVLLPVDLGHPVRVGHRAVSLVVASLPVPRVGGPRTVSRRPDGDRRRWRPGAAGITGNRHGTSDPRH